MKRLTFFLIALLFVCCASKNEPLPKDLTFDSAVKLAKEQNKLVLVDFYSPT